MSIDDTSEPLAASLPIGRFFKQVFILCEENAAEFSSAIKEVWV